MFKRFLKFFRGDEGSPQEAFDGSYLDHLLQQVRPNVVAQLEECPEHDPLLLVVVGILRYTMINAWSPKLRAPLADSNSPGRDAPPGGVEAGPSSDSTDEFETAAAINPDETEEIRPDDVLAEESIDEADAETGAPDAQDDELEAEPSDDEDDIPQSPAPAPQSALRKTEEIDVSEIREASRRASREAPADTTFEREVVQVEQADPTIEIEQDTLFEAQKNDDRPRIDTEEVLQAGRMFLGLLIENDRLPLELQLTVAETTLARDLLLGYFVANTDFEDKARRLLTLVEQKFAEEHFSQASILLELFQTDDQTRINNDRNLFYEDMILRLGIRRRHRMSAEELRRFETLISGCDNPEGAQEMIDWLGDSCLIRFQTFNRDPEHVAVWGKIAGASTRADARETFLRYLPPRRWRALGHYPSLDAVEQVQRHVTIETAREYVISLLKTCYFVLRAVGDTGLEGYLDTFFDWADVKYGVDATRIMPELYKRSMMDPEPMAVILDDIYDEFFGERTPEIIDRWGDEEIESAIYLALNELGECDLGEIAPGYYDFGAFVFDRLFDVRYPSPEFSFKIHRLT